MISVRHVGVVVNDVEKSLLFYRDLLGFSIVNDQLETGKSIETFLGLSNAKVRTIKMKSDSGAMIELLNFINPMGYGKPLELYNFGCTHFALTVDNLDLLYNLLINNGIRFVNPPSLSENGLAKVAFCKDPEGTFIELVEEL